jgi:hypothetical protein
MPNVGGGVQPTCGERKPPSGGFSPPVPQGSGEMSRPSIYQLQPNDTQRLPEFVLK